MKYFLFIFFILISTECFSQTLNKLFLTLIEDEVSFLKKQEKYSFKDSTISLNNEKIYPAKIKIRGQHCLESKRKCFSIKISSPFLFHKHKKSFSSKNFYLISLWQDEGYITSALGHEFFKVTDLFNLNYSYTEVYINNKSYGLYLVLENPKNFLKKKKNSPFILRRRYFDNFEINFSNLSEQKSTEMSEIFEALHKKKIGLDYIKDHLNLENYFKWLAVNYFLKNGDYTDEIFFFLNSEKSRFEIMPWDLDDLFKKPHPQFWNSILFKSRLNDSFFYSMESKLDRNLFKNKKAYAEYLEVFQKILSEISEDLIHEVFDNVRNEIGPYLENSESLQLSSLDDRNGPPYTKEYIQNLLDQREAFLIKRRYELLNKIWP